MNPPGEYCNCPQQPCTVDRCLHNIQTAYRPPLEPTEVMIMAGTARLNEVMGQYAYEHIAREIYLAMVAVAK